MKIFERRKLGLTICLGDLVGYGAYPNEVINLIREKKILTIMGNHDDAVSFERLVCGCDYPDPKDAENAGKSLAFSIDSVSGGNKEYLRGLPLEANLKFDEKSFRFVHGSPRKINEYLKENSQEADEVMRDFKEDVLVCGHTHLPYSKGYSNKILINAGSVGKSKTGRPHANYVIIDTSGKTEIIEVEYDYNAAADAIEEAGLPPKFSEILRTGRP